MNPADSNEAQNTAGAPEGSVVPYESPDLERPASAATTENNLEQQTPGGHEVRGHDPYAALRFREYRFFSMGWMIAVIGSAITSAAIGWEIYDRTHSARNIAWIAGIQALPVILLALPAGAIADVFDRRRVILCSTIASAFCSLAMAWFSYLPGKEYVMYILLLAISTAQAMGRPARSALLPNVLPVQHFANAITWNASFFQIASMIGPMIAGAVIGLSLSRLGSVALAYAIDAACALSFGILVMQLPRSRRRSVDGPLLAQLQQVFKTLNGGASFIWRTRIIFATLTLDLFAVLLGGAIYLLPLFSKDILKVGSVGFGWLRAADAIGSLAMGMLIAHMPPMKRAGRSMLLAVAMFGVVTIAFGLSHNFYLSFFLLMLSGAFDNVSVVVRHTLVQVMTPDSMRGRVSAVNSVFIGASNELGGLESGLVSDWMGPVTSVVSGGIGTIITVILIAWIFPQVRKFGSLHDAARAPQEPQSPAAA